MKRIQFAYTFNTFKPKGFSKNNPANDRDVVEKSTDLIG